VSLDIDHYYRKYGAMVFRRCMQMLGNEAAAQDAVQDVFLALVKAAHRIKDDAMSSLLYRMATNTCLNILKRSKKTINKDETFFSQIETRDDFSETFAARDLIARLFANEKPHMLELAVMRYVDNLTHEEIAKICDISVSGVRKRLRTLSEKAQKFKADVYG